MIKSKKDYNKIINNIQKIREKNNSSWMQILKIAFKYSPKKTAKVLGNIYLDDKKINLLAKKLLK
jgi:hypothetical protein|tara:strand:- start:360 stop:554 length:195 start_codon:yes stop_codon:yes gene_type:complete